MKLYEYLQTECIEASAAVSDKFAVLQAITRLAKRNPILKEVTEDQILRGLKQREDLGTTGFGDGIAIPHCRIAGMSDFVMGIMTIPDGVDFDSMDEKPVQLVVFVFAPEEESNAYIKLLSIISQTLKIPGTVEEIVSQLSPEKIRESFLRHTLASVETRGRENKRLFHAIVQDENIFQQILQVFEAMESSSVMVIEAKNIREYLVKMPLFASFWSDSHLGTSRIIIAAVESALTNETIRAIENITGNLDRRTGVMIMVQDILYAAGSLEM